MVSSLSSTRSLLLMIDEMYTLAVVDCDCRSFALRPRLLRANVIKSPITNASLQASAAAGCSVGAALAGVSTYSGFSDDWQTQRFISCAILDVLLLQKQCCDFLSQPLLHQRDFTRKLCVQSLSLACQTPPALFSS